MYHREVKLSFEAMINILVITTLAVAGLALARMGPEPCKGGLAASSGFVADYCGQGK